MEIVNMINGGLVSITFRQRSVREIVELVAKTELKAIEWGGDVHVPHGNLAKAKEARQMTSDAGLICASYGSYYRLGVSEKEGLSFNAVADVAAELGAPTVRVWAGGKGSDGVDCKYREQIVEEALKVADTAQRAGVSLSFEYHGGTLTDTDESAMQFLKEADHENLFLYWQPPLRETMEERLKGLSNILELNKLTNLHVFKWEVTDDGFARLPLSDGVSEWIKYFEIVGKCSGDRCAMIEFVKNDSPEQFMDDAATLAGMLN